MCYTAFVNKEWMPAGFTLFYVKIIIYVASTSGKCPSIDLTNCTCSTSHTAYRVNKFSAPPAPRVTLRCQKVNDVKALTKLFRALQGNQIDAVHILDSPIGPSIPANLFSGLPLSEVTLSGVDISALSSPDSTPFLGLEQTLISLALRRCNMRADMTLEKLTALDHIEQIDLSYNILRFLRRRWFSVPPSSLRSLILKGNRIEAIESLALHNVYELVFLDLSENRICSLQRTMFPDKLEILHLENNRLTDLEDDLFASMLRLRRLYLANNRIHTLKHSTFSPVWFKIQPSLEEVDVRGNPVICDCLMSWLSETIVLWRNSRTLLGYCSAPSAFVGDQLRGLDCFKLRCFNANCTQLVPNRSEDSSNYDPRTVN
ncbi:leucine-rich repeat and immunoglobulin-like domain-containing nogo receptor-interacting protein 3 isoform X2 [Varroa jacobsoni]|uniref:leucine-rich repeat and immunoglobulin-like domain-containing nogo receptor-interacting protein 3 isoform X2 n=1 Tax=Varroa jacobsoni TaxID=62625 RepID=UPI000BF73734|nr:leucine-rich repeat and immunoglobulin-like domain-containing nogo receptor-interacting protein 3 isoform X2 [Varroa jacobsoni]